MLPTPTGTEEDHVLVAATSEEDGVVTGVVVGDHVDKDDVVGTADETTGVGDDLTDEGTGAVEERPAATAPEAVDVITGAAAWEEDGWLVEIRAGVELPPDV